MFSHIKELFTRPSGYTISRSVRLRSSASAYFNRTPASAGNRKTWTYSCWVKRGKFGLSNALLEGTPATSQLTSLDINGGETLSVQDYVAGSYNLGWATTAVYREPSAWYHIVAVYDTTQASSANAVKFYVNGVQQTVTFNAYNGSYVQNRDGFINATNSHFINRYDALSSNQYGDGYLTEINFIDGQALTPSSFGETDSITGVWKAKKYGGTYGTNGFYLNFSDNSNNTATTIGKDYSGNGNNWTPNNISVTSGSTYDSMLDVPTPYADGGNGRGNYCVMNPVNTVGSPTLSAGNLNATGSASQSSFSGTVGANSGKYYAEFSPTSIGGAVHFGVFALGGNANGGNVGSGQDSRCIYRNDGAVFTSSQVATYATYTTSNTIGVALNLDASPPTAAFYKDNSLQGTVNLSTSFSNWTFAVLTNGSSDAGVVNFGQRPFTYTPPSGFVALNTQNLPDSTIKNGAAYMAASLYTGNGATQTITNTVGSTSFQPDFIWAKNRTTSGSNHRAFDSVRGTSKILYPSLTNSEDTNANGLTSFNSNGFSIGDASINDSGAEFVAWQWKAGGSSSSNTNGSITSTVSVGATQGFSVVKWAVPASPSGSNTIGHGLGVAPNLIITKSLSTSGWPVYTSSTGAGNVLFLHNTNASSANDAYSATPSSSVFTVSYASGSWGAGTNQISYCFSAVKGFSAFGSYTGNGSTDGPFVYTGFRPRFVLVKDATTAGGYWEIHDTSRSTYNATTARLWPNVSSAEATGADIDFLSNGFKIRTTDGTVNNSGSTVIYAAFAENPFKNALAR